MADRIRMFQQDPFDGLTAQQHLLKLLRSPNNRFANWDENEIILTNNLGQPYAIFSGPLLAVEQDGTLSGLVENVRFFDGFRKAQANMDFTSGFANFSVTDLVTQAGLGSGPLTPANHPGFFSFIAQDAVETAGTRFPDVVQVGLGVTSALTKAGNDHLLMLTSGFDANAGKGNKDVLDGSEMARRFGVDLSTGQGSDGSNFTVSGVEWVFGSDFDDILTGNNRKNTLKGGDGNDRLAGSGGNDNLVGGDGSDDIDGGDGNDKIVGGKGPDTLRGGAGDDTISGGPGPDTFVFGAGDGDDVVTDYNKRQDDLIFEIAVSRDNTRITRANGDTLLEIDSDGDGSFDGSILFKDVRLFGADFFDV